MNAPKIWRPDRMPLVPAIFALAAAWLALSPSLLPRPGVFQGLVCALAAILGYGLGSFVRWLIHEFDVKLWAQRRRLGRWIFFVLAIAGTVYALASHVFWQNELRDRLGMERLEFGHVTLTIVVSFVLFALFLVIARALRTFGRVVVRLVSRFLPPRVAIVSGVGVVTLVALTLLDNVVVSRVVKTVDSAFYTINQEFTTDLPAPTSSNLSAGKGSDVTWESLGRQGRLFIANAPSPEEISKFSGVPAKQPVRAYIGVGSEGDIDLADEAELAVAELERTGGFDRAVINIATGTGRGWVNENSAQALEYMWNGDTATVSMQYSYLPSWASFIVDRDRAQEAGRLLFEAVYARWADLPPKNRPLLVVSGESLGSFGGEAAFSGAPDLARRVDGALFVGPTGNNTLWRRFTADRAEDSPQIMPIYNDGKVVRFSADGKTWAGGLDWMGTRIGYLQHDNDPITWWTSELTFHKPDWLREAPGEHVVSRMRWIPIITMLQVGVDQFVANSVPAGQGHLYGQSPVYAWATILAPEGWNQDKTEALADVVKNRAAATVDNAENAEDSVNPNP